MKPTKVHVVPHMHWDREWYFSTEESRILLVNNMEEIMERLENDETYLYYVLDGQTAILEDYFAVKPENKQRVKDLVQQGKLIIGPWYSQTDEMVVGAESIVRNLLYGFKDCAEFGEVMKIGYLPDSFGQSAQMPQILNGFDITRSIFWRGVSERKGTNKTEFNWKSDEGSEVLVQLFPLGYAIGKYLPLEKEALKKRMDKYLPVLDRGATTDHIILPNGHDQMPIQQNIFEVMDALKELYPERDFFISKYENVFDELEKNENLDTISGEFLDGKYMRVHRSIFSTRMDIKALNARIESKLTNVLEPLAAIAYNLGFEYHHGLIELIWKEIMKNHAHDSIGCCCSDKVHLEVLNRFLLAEEKTDQLIRFYLRKVVDNLETTSTDDRLNLFNLMPYEREEVITTKIITKMTSFEIKDNDGNNLNFEILSQEEIDAGLIDRQIVHYGNYDPFIQYTIEFKDTVPSMGYKTYFIQEAETTATNSVKSTDKIVTEFYEITANQNGTINIVDKKLNKTFTNVLRMENGGDDGDEYDFSPLPNETLIYNDDVVANVTLTQNEFAGRISISYELNVPADLEKRKEGVRDTLVGINIELVIPNHKALIDTKITINNTACDHRLRTLIPTGIASKVSISDNQFGYIERDVYDSAMDVWEKEDWDERPDSIYPMLTYVGLCDNEHGVSVLTNSTREYEIIDADYSTIAITLFRSVGFLGKEEMLRRPGRPSGIKMPTPDSQMLGTLMIDFGITTHAGTTLEANIANVAKEYLTPVQVYNKIPHDAMKLNKEKVQTPLTYSLLSFENKDSVLSVLKKAEKEEALVVRAFNPTTTNQQLEVVSNNKISNVGLVNLNEDKQKDLEDIKIELLPNQVGSVIFSIN